MTALTFLGTGNFEAQGRYWNSFLLDGTVLVEPSPTVVSHLPKLGTRAGDLDAVVISHFHADHTFGWPFLLQRIMNDGRTAPLHVVGPPGTEAFLADMLLLGGVPNLLERARRSLPVNYIEVDGAWQQAGTLRFRAVEVDHAPDLRCFGYLFDRGENIVGYSGDTRPCAALDELASAADTLVLECNGEHVPDVRVTHMDVAAVRALHDAFPSAQLVLTHLGPDVGPAAFDDLVGVTVAADFETVEV